MDKNIYAMIGITPTRETVYKAVCDVWDIPRECLMLHTRKREIVEPRQVAFYYLREILKKSPGLIGSDGGFDHATVNHAVKVVENLKETCKIFREKYDEFLKKLA